MSNFWKVGVSVRVLVMALKVRPNAPAARRHCGGCIRSNECRLVAVFECIGFASA